VSVDILFLLKRTSPLTISIIKWTISWTLTEYMSMTISKYHKLLPWHMRTHIGQKFLLRYRSICCKDFSSTIKSLKHYKTKTLQIYLCTIAAQSFFARDCRLNNFYPNFILESSQSYTGSVHFYCNRGWFKKKKRYLFILSSMNKHNRTRSEGPGVWSCSTLIA